LSSVSRRIDDGSMEGVDSVLDSTAGAIVDAGMANVGEFPDAKTVKRDFEELELELELAICYRRIIDHRTWTDDEGGLATYIVDFL
jgi:hypothetical protein